MLKVYDKVWIALSVVLMWLPAAQSRQQQQPSQQQQSQSPQSQQTQQPQDQPSQPIPAYHSPLAGLAGNQTEDNPDPSALSPDNRPLAGAQDVALGAPRTEHSYWEPNFVLSTTADSNPLSSDSSGWVNYTTLLGGVNIHQISKQSNLTLTYLGGGMISNASGVPDAVIQEFGVTEQISLRRSVVSLFEQASYLPETGLGFGGIGGGLGLPGGSLGLQNGFIPDQSILTARAQRLTNTSIGQFDYALTPRSSLTFLGGYSLLHFFGSDFLNFGEGIFQAGYNYQLTRLDTIAVLDNFNAYRYSSFGESINDNRVNISYARRITGRLAFQVAAGPEIAAIQAPSQSLGSGGTNSTLQSTTNIYWNLNTSITYQFARTGLEARYSHGLNGGSGALGGAVGDSVGGSVSRVFSRTANGDAHFGYARNSSIAGITGVAGQTYDYWFAGGNLNHTWGRTLNLGVNYQLQYQTANSNFCIGQQCGPSFVRNTISVVLSWRDHPLLF